MRTCTVYETFKVGGVVCSEMPLLQSPVIAVTRAGWVEGGGDGKKK